MLQKEILDLDERQIWSRDDAKELKIALNLKERFWILTANWSTENCWLPINFLCQLGSQRNIANGMSTQSPRDVIV